MKAVIEKVEDGYIERFERSLHHSVEKVWVALTDNKKLERWFSNLQVIELRKGGTIKFNMNDGSGSSIDMEITDFKKGSILEYEWGDGRVRFELYSKSVGCLLIMKEFISTLNDHTPKDLAGWHVSLDILSALLNDHYMDFPKDEWEKWYKKYSLAVKQIEQ